MQAGNISTFMLDYFWSVTKHRKEIDVEVAWIDGRPCSLYFHVSYPGGVTLLYLYILSEIGLSRAMSEIQFSIRKRAYAATKIHFACAPGLDPGAVIQTIRHLFEGSIFQKSTTIADRMHLGNSFEQFVASRGKRTRRNIKYYMRKVEEAGCRFEANVEWERRRDDIRALAPFNHPVVPSAQTRRVHQDILGALDRTVVSGLFDADGSLISVTGGYRNGTEYYMLFQYNHKAFKHLSFGISHCGLLFENLIQEGITSCVFLGGVHGSFANYCEKHEYIQAISQSPNLWGRMMVNVASTLGPRWNLSEYTAINQEEDS